MDNLINSITFVHFPLPFTAFVFAQQCSKEAFDGQIPVAFQKLQA